MKFNSLTHFDIWACTTYILIRSELNKNILFNSLTHFEYEI